MAMALRALLELEQILRVKKVTLEEEKFLDAWKFEATRGFYSGAILGMGFAWITPWRFNLFFRNSVAGGAAVIFGFWRFNRSTSSWVDHILALDGTRMQKELKDMMVTRWGNIPQTKQYLSKHFYLEKVFDDSTSIQPKLRCRRRSFYSDGGALGPGTNVNDSDSNLHSISDSHNTVQSEIATPRTDFDSKPIFMMPSPDPNNPLDSIFGPMGGTEEPIHHPNASETPTKPHIHGWKISRWQRQRQRHMRHRRASTNSNTSPVAG